MVSQLGFQTAEFALIARRAGDRKVERLTAASDIDLLGITGGVFSDVVRELERPRLGGRISLFSRLRYDSLPNAAHDGPLLARVGCRDIKLAILDLAAKHRSLAIDGGEGDRAAFHRLAIVRNRASKTAALPTPDEER